MLSSAHVHAAVKEIFSLPACPSLLQLPVTIVAQKGTPAEQPAEAQQQQQQQQPAGPPPGFADWHPANVFPPVAVQVSPSAPPLPAEALEPGGDFWARVAGVAAEQAAKQQASGLPSNKPSSAVPSNTAPK